MYRRPNLEYAEHLKGYKNLKYVFVELEEHKRILVRNGINEKKVLVYRTPSLFTPQRNKKSYNPRNVNLLFASWNNAEGNPLEERGINYLLNLVAHNPNLTLTVMPRDNLTNEFTQKVKVMNLGARVKMKWPIGLYELKQIFQKCDFVAFTPKIKISKDVPNSIIDGLSLGKPCIITNIIDFSRVVEDRRMGLVINDLGLFKFTINKENYLLMSKYAYDYSSLHSDDAYSELIDNYK
jgi:glycosyltransferase involved in cell wall biosynthesis